MHPRLTHPRWVMIPILLLFTVVVFAQKTISGRVTNAANQPVAGASVVVKGTNIGTTTDQQGRYTISIPNDQATLVVSFVGLGSREMAVSGRSSLDFVLNETGSTLNEVVVTGYTSQAKKDITGSVAVVNVKELTANPGSNIQTLLQGRA
ncbi:MAG: carboxypeptidase-like regulatory domain-containing protein, partial [Flavisolibacter sp.]|nr:carboxypeptidase-like regulatory domain-containing protein [Flavisolibacter sp.]